MAKENAIGKEAHRGLGEQSKVENDDLIFGDFDKEQYEHLRDMRTEQAGVEFLFDFQESAVISPKKVVLGHAMDNLENHSHLSNAIQENFYASMSGGTNRSVDFAPGDSCGTAHVVFPESSVNNSESAPDVLVYQKFKTFDSNSDDNAETKGLTSTNLDSANLEPRTSGMSNNNREDESDNEFGETRFISDHKIGALSEETATEAGTKPGKPVSWAALFKSDGSSSLGFQKDSVSVTVSSEQAPLAFSLRHGGADIDVKLIPYSHDKRALKMADFISKQIPNYSTHHLQLRGLVNRGNWCYINTTLQALLGIAPITHFYKSLKPFYEPCLKSTSTPLTDSMIAFLNEFEPFNPKVALKKQTDDLRTGHAFEPKFVYDVLPVMKTSLSEKGRQEDAEEFLTFMLNGIHEELAAMRCLVQERAVAGSEEHGHLNGTAGKSELTEEAGDDESWEQVGPRNKSATVRKSMMDESLVKHVFGGVIRSSVHQSGVKESATLQPFFTLQLDIQSEKIWTLTEAIDHYFTKENLQGFTCAKTKSEVEASRRSTLEELPNIFIFHLKYFVYDPTGGCQKLHKAITIPVDLEIPKDILSPAMKAKVAQNIRNYRLFAVVYHHGKNAAGGHYTAAVNHGNPFGWVRFDDNIIKTVPVAQVLKHQQGRVPYLLFYERLQPW